MCKRTQWLNVGKPDFLLACKDRRIGAERAELLWERLNELAKQREIATIEARKKASKTFMGVPVKKVVD